MVLIFEGMDRTSKSTQIALAKEFLEYKGITVHYLHYSNIKGKKNNLEIMSMSKKLYKQMFKLLYKANSSDTCLICDRAHLGEYVYSPLYREYDGSYVFNLEKKYIDKFPNKDIALIVLSDTEENLIKRDDGLSFSIKKEDKKIERAVFKQAFEESIIPIKRYVELNGRGPDIVFEEDVVPVISQLLKNSQETETEQC